MSNEFKPGDVVVHPKYGRGIVQTKGWVEFADVGNYADYADVAADLRRLVVIDAEDRRQVEQLEAAVREANGWNMLHHERRTAALQAALREFADPKPPRPEEPTGLGAVVEATHGNYFVRSERNPDRPWDRRGGGVCSYGWGEIDAVRVISEGA